MGECKRANNDRRGNDRRINTVPVADDRRQNNRRSGVDRRELGEKGRVRGKDKNYSLWVFVNWFFILFRLVRFCFI